MGTGKLYNIGHVSSLAISGGTVLTDNLTLNANTISGLIDPIYPSAAANKHYIDTISGNLAGGLTDTPSNWTTLTAGTGFESFEGSIGVSGSTGVSLDISGYDVISGNAKSGQSAQYWLLQSGSSYSHTNFIASSVAIGRFSDSSNVNWTKITAISSGFDGRLDALEGASYIDTSGTPADDDFAKFTDADTIEGRSYSETRSDLGIQELLDSGTKYTNAYTWYNASANALSQIHASGEEYSSAYASAQALKIHSFHSLISGGYLESGSEYAKAYASAQIAYYTDAHVDHDQTTNFVSDEHIDHTGVDITAGAGLTGGGSIDSTRTLDVGAGTGIAVNTDDIEVMGYSTISSNAKAGADYISSGNEYSAAYDWYTESSSKISDFVASGEEYSAAYTHSQDNTQAHSDYLLNNSDDSTTGTLTAKSFSGPLSGTNLSGGTIQFTTFASATDATAAELEELTDGSETTLHSHAGGGGGTTSTFEFINAGTGLGGWADDAYGVSSSAGSAMSPEVLGYSTISSNAQWSQNWLNVSGSQVSSIIGSGSEYSQAYASAQIALYGVSTSNIGGLSDVTSSSPKSGQVLVYGADETNTTWQNAYPPISYSIANVRISAQQNINLGKFTLPSNKTCYAIQAYAANSGGASVGDLKVQMLSGSIVKFSTSSNILQQYSNPSSSTGDIEIRFAYSGSNVSGIEYGTCLCQVLIV